MGKNTKVVSLSLFPETHALMKRVASERDIGVSELVRDVFENFLEVSPSTQASLICMAEKRGVSVPALVDFIVSKFPLDDDSVKLIVHKIPKNIIENESMLKEWLDSRRDALVKHLHG